MAWPQNYDPLGAWQLSTAVSALPVISLFVSLIVFKTRVWVAALAGFVVAFAIALVVFRMPVAMVASAARTERSSASSASPGSSLHRSSCIKWRWRRGSSRS